MRVFGKTLSPLGTPLDDWASSRMMYRGPTSDYGQGPGIEDRIKNGELAFGKLLEILMSKGLVDQEEVFKILEIEDCEEFQIRSE